MSAVLHSGAAARVPVGLIRPLQLRDGRCVLVRPVLPQDGDAEQAFFGALSATSRYRRFHVGLRTLPSSTLQQLIQVDHEHHVALVAQQDNGHDEDEPAIVADARYVRTGPRSAEFALAVADEWQRLGLGRQLLCQLARYAARHGIGTLTGDVLADNAPMIAMLRGLDCHAGAELQSRADEPGLLLATIALGTPRDRGVPTPPALQRRAAQARWAAASSSRV